MLGAVSPDSFDTLHSYSNTFQMPFVTPWFPEKVSIVHLFVLGHCARCKRDQPKMNKRKARMCSHYHG